MTTQKTVKTSTPKTAKTAIAKSVAPSKAEVKHNDFMSTVLNISNEQATRSSIFEAKFADTKDTDDKAIHLKANTKSTYSLLITKMSDKAAKAALKLFKELDIVECINDSYSVKKFVILCEALAVNSKDVLNRDNKLIKFMTAYALASQNDTYTKYHNACNRSDRQTQMSAKMLERLTQAKYSKAKDYFEQNVSHSAHKAIFALFE